MSTDQAEAAAPAVDETPAAEAKTETSRTVDDFLADLDDVLATSTAPAAPSPESEPVPDAAATMPDVDLDLDVEEPTVPDDTPLPLRPRAQAPAPDPAPASAKPERDWWGEVYDDDKADQDTFTGNVPTAQAPAVPPKPDHAPDVPAKKDDDQDQVADEAEDGGDEEEAPAKRRKWSLRKKDQDDEGQADDEDEAPAKAPKGKKSKGGGGHASPAGKELNAAYKAAVGGFLHPKRGRKLVFAASAYGLGWTFHWDDLVTGLMVHADQYAIPVTGCALLGGLICLGTGTKGGAVIFMGSLGLITAMAMVEPARAVGGGVALGGHAAYQLFRRWLGHHGNKWPWKAVAWVAFAPVAASTVAFLLYGTN